MSVVFVFLRHYLGECCLCVDILAVETVAFSVSTYLDCWWSDVNHLMQLH